MSAKTALYSRMIMSGVATDDQREIFAKCGAQNHLKPVALPCAD